MNKINISILFSFCVFQTTTQIYSKGLWEAIAEAENLECEARKEFEQAMLDKISPWSMQTNEAEEQSPETDLNENVDSN